MDAAAPLTVLVVDDQVDAADSTAALLCLMGYDAHAAYSARQAIDRFRELQPRVVLMDIGMPEMSGLETAACIRTMPEGTEATIIALTGFGEETHGRLSREASMDYYLVKPAAPEVLEEVLRRAIAH